MNMNTSKKQEGFVIAVVAIVLVALVGFLALAVDIGVLYSARTSAQGVADAAALAGAFTFINDTKSPQPQTASDNALQVALNNSILGQPVAAGDVNVNVDTANRRVTVDVQSTQNTYFARALGVQTANVGVEAVAEASPNSTGTACAKPWFIPNTALGAGGACPACAANQVLVSGGQVTAFGQSKIGQRRRNPPVFLKCSYSLDHPPDYGRVPLGTDPPCDFRILSIVDVAPVKFRTMSRFARTAKNWARLLYSFHLHLSSFLQQFLWLCVLHRGHSLLPFALYQNRGRRFARVGLFAGFHVS